MYELYPYFTNDGSVGLFSQQDDDIYHSTYGALSESWQKFIIPAHLQEYLTQHEGVKILDICYGIGYNTKTALNVFINNYLEIKKNSQKKKLFSSFFSKKCMPSPLRCAAIDTDNASMGNNIENFKNIDINAAYTIAEIDADNICGMQNAKWEKMTRRQEGRKASCNFALQNRPNHSPVHPFTYSTKSKPSNHPFASSVSSLLIDAVDIDKTLINLSPFIADASWFNFLFKNDYEIPIANEIKYRQIKNIKNFKKFIRKEFKLNKAVLIILIKKLFENKPEVFNDTILQIILNHKKYAPFLSRFMINFAKFYQNQGYNYNKKKNKSAFLHNIYYKYISKSYKTARKLLLNCKIDINFHEKDARCFIKSTTNTYNFIFLDAFTPAKCPALWTVQFFRELYSKLEDDGMILTYSNSAAIRNAFLQAGFAVGKTYDANLKKFTGTVAAKNKTLIEYNLDELDWDLINSKAGICFKDENLELTNQAIIENRKIEVKESELISSSKILKGHRNDHVKPV